MKVSGWPPNTGWINDKPFVGNKQGKLPDYTDSRVTFENGWDLGRIEAIQEVLTYIEDLKNPVYGDL